MFLRAIVLLSSAALACGGESSRPDAAAPACDLDASTFTLADAQSFPNGIALSGGRAFWADSENGPIMSAAPCESPVVVANESGMAIAVDDANVYWTSRVDSLHISLRAAPRNGGTPITLASDPMPDALTNIALDDTFAYFGSAGGVVRVSKTGASAPTFVETSLPVQWALAVDATNVYFGSLSGLMTVSKNGGVPTVLAPATGPTIGAIVLDDATVYWAASAPQSPPVANDWMISSISKTGGEVTVLASDEVAVSSSGGMGVDATFVWWSNDAKELRYVARSGGASSVRRISGLGAGLAVGDHMIVWTGFFDGVVAGIRD